MYEWVVKRLQYAEMEHIKYGEDKLAVLCRDAAHAIEELSVENKKLDETIKRAYLIINSLIPNMEGKMNESEM